jgi:hypothetical protein
MLRKAHETVGSAFAVASTHQFTMGPRDGLWFVLLMSNLEEGLCSAAAESGGVIDSYSSSLLVKLICSITVSTYPWDIMTFTLLPSCIPHRPWLSVICPQWSTCLKRKEIIPHVSYVGRLWK